MTRHIRQIARKALSKPYIPVCLILATFIIHLGFIFGQTFSADDHLQRFVFLSNPSLDRLGITPKEKTLSATLTNQFNFFDANELRFDAQKKYGVLPWWINDNAKLHLFRPIASLTHWIDYQLWPDSLTLMHATSLLLLILAYLAALLLYRSLEPKPWLAFSAFILFFIDVSMIFPLTWLASRNIILVIGFTALSLFFLQRSYGKPSSLILSLLCFAASILSAEAGITTFGFILAYLLILDKRKTPIKIAILLLFLSLIALWKVGYIMAGFGSTDVGNYLDPLNEPLDFFLQCFTQYPLLLVNSLTGIEGFVGSLYTSFFGFTLIVLLCFACYRIQQRALWFWFCALLFSFIPYLALPATAPRFTVLPHLATAAIFAHLLFTPATRIAKSKFGRNSYRVLLCLIICLHLLISPLIIMTTSLLAANTNLMSHSTTNQNYNRFEPTNIKNKHLIILQSADPFRLMFYPYKATFYREPLAASIQQIAPATSSLIIETLSSRHLRVDIPHGLILTGKEVQQQLDSTGRQLLPRDYDFYGFFYQGHYKEKIGNRHSFDAYTITINALNKKNQVTQLDITLKYPYDSNHYYWMTWNSQSSQYQHIQLPEIREKRLFKGLLETVGAQ